MKKHFAIATLVTLTAAISMAPASGADAVTDAGQVKLQSESIPALRQSIASAAGYELQIIELKHTAHQLTVTIVNSKQNGATSIDRERAAIAIASVAERGMNGKPEFEGIGAIHIDYISRVGKEAKTIQMFDLFRSPANVFVLHKT